jgi:hypothetical protein
VTFRPGFPSVGTPRDATRATQVAIDNIRARLAQLESELTALTSTTQQSVVSLQSSVAAATAASSSSTSSAVTYTAAVNITAGQAVYESSSGYVSVADPTVLAGSYAVLGVAQKTVGAGSKITVATDGQVAIIGGGLTATYPVFCGPLGQLSQSPFYGYPALQVGIALSPTQILVHPDNQLIAVLVNGTTVGYRRAINFIVNGSVALFGADNPGQNRVDITIGSGGTIVGLRPTPSYVALPQVDANIIAPQIRASLHVANFMPPRPFVASPGNQPGNGAAFGAGQVAGH